MRLQLTCIVLSAALLVPGGDRVDAEDKPADNTAGSRIMIPAIRVTDYLHAIIEADRMFYTMHVVERLQKKGTIVSSENWRETNTLPLPAQFLMESNELGGEIGSPVRYRLVGRWPINSKNGAASEFEQKGLESVQLHSDRPYTGIIAKDDRKWFTAIYADLAITQACIGCHNAHPNSPKRDFKLGDVMGALVISIPAE